MWDWGVGHAKKAKDTNNSSPKRNGQCSVCVNSFRKGISAGCFNGIWQELKGRFGL